MVQDKPRIAFCFSWQARTLDQTYLFFQRNLIDAAKEQWFDYDVFCAVEDDEDVDKVNYLHPTKVEKIKSREVRKIIDEKYGDFIKTAFKTRYKWAFYSYESVVNALQQLFKKQISVNMVNSETYDIIVMLRFDILFINKWNFKNIMEELRDSNCVICNSQPKDWIWWLLYADTLIIQDFFFIWSQCSI